MQVALGVGLFLAVFLSQVWLHRWARDKEASEDVINQQSLTLTDYAVSVVVSLVTTIGVLSWTGVLGE